MDNRVFNVNGKTKAQLELALRSLLRTEYIEDDYRKVEGYYFSKEKGFVLTWITNDKYKGQPFCDRLGKPKPIEITELTDLLFEWLDSDEAIQVPCEGWDANADHDGSNDRGWRLYTEEWGCINESETSIDHYSIAAFKPAYIWYGK